MFSNDTEPSVITVKITCIASVCCHGNMHLVRDAVNLLPGRNLTQQVFHTTEEGCAAIDHRVSSLLSSNRLLGWYKVSLKLREQSLLKKMV